MIVKELEDYQHYTGTYESLTATLIIKEEKDAFKMSGIRKRDSLIMGDYSLIPDSKAFFTIENGYFGQLFFDKNNNVTGFRTSKGSFRRDYKKVN